MKFDKELAESHRLMRMNEKKRVVDSVDSADPELTLPPEEDDEDLGGQLRIESPYEVQRKDWD